VLHLPVVFINSFVDGSYTRADIETTQPNVFKPAYRTSAFEDTADMSAPAATGSALEQQRSKALKSQRTITARLM
jgi:hypothetical protein